MKNYLAAILILCLFAISGYTQTETIEFNANKIKAIQSDIRANDQRAVEVPYISGQTLSLNLMPHELFSGKIKEQFPNHKNYRVFSSEDPSISGFLIDSPTGLYYSLNTLEGFVSFRPTKKNNIYQIERGFSEGLEEHICQVKEDIHQHVSANSRVDVPFSSGEFLRIYRMAMVVTGEFYENNGNNDDDVLSVVQETLNGLNAIFQRELAINFEVGNRLIFFTESENDPFIPDNTGGASRPEQASTVINDNFDDDDFDIGHVLHNTSGSDDWSGGGVASLRGLCRSNKAAAWSGSRNNIGNSWIQLFSHEVGHQLGANHTFNGTGSNCTSAISANNAYEIASGTTIMSYRGICDAEYNIPFSSAVDNYFHINSLNAMIDHVNDAGNCNTVFETNNIPPDLQINPCNVEAYRIPTGTPFRISAFANDLNGDEVTYAWEQYDEDGEAETPTQGFIGDEAANSTIAPLFRNYAPTTNPERIIPPLSDILSGEQNPFEVLPVVERNITMRMTARDNFAGGGTISVDEINISVEAGPFELVTPSATNNFYEAGNSMLIEWNTNGSDDLCNNVDIFLSTDGGFTFNLPIAENVSYSQGNFTWDIPGGLQRSPNNRIRIECADYSCFSFFIISDPFEIDSDCEGNAHFICDTEDLFAQEGSPVLNLELESVIGQKVLGAAVTIDSDDASQVFVRNSLTGACQIPTFASGNPVTTLHESRIFTVEESGNYTFRRLTSGFYSIFNTDMLNSNAPCEGFLGSNAAENPNNPGTTSTASFNTVSVQLEACQSYTILFTTFQAPLDMAVDVSGSEIILNDDLLEGTSFTYVAVDIQTNKVAFISETADLRDIDPGFYEVYGVQYQDGLDQDSWIGQSFDEILIQGDCFIQGSNNKEVSVLDDGIDPCEGFFILTDSTPSDCVEPSGTASVQMTEGNPPFNIDWSNGEKGATIVDLFAGTYTVTVTDSEACVQEATVTVALSAPLTVGVIENNGMLIAQVNNGSGMYIYEWRINNVTNPVITENIELIQSGTYTVIVTDTGTGCINSASFEFENPCAGLMTESSFSNPTCFGTADGSIVVEVAGGEAPYSFEWNDGLGTDNFLADIEAGLYTLVVSDNAGCSSQTTFELSNPDEIILSLDASNESSLGSMDGSVFAMVEGGVEPFSYEWDNGSNTDNIVNLAAGEYCLTVTDANGCVAEACIEVQAGADPCIDFSVEIESTDVTCFDIPNGIATAIVSEGMEPFQYFWSHSVSGEVVGNLAAGMYEVTVIDINNCEAIASIEITQPDELILELIKENESTLGAVDGSTEAAVTGGTEPYSYEWTNGETSPSLEMLEPGQYCVTVSDANECTIQDCITIVEGSNPCADFTVSAESSDVSCFDFANGTAIAVAENGLEPYAYAWSNGETTMSVNDLEPGLYGVTVMDANGCDGVVIVEISEPDEIFLQLSAEAESSLGVADGTATAMANGGLGDFTYLWDNGETTETITMLAAGTYCVTVTDPTDCTLEDCIEVMAGADPCEGFEIEISGTDATCFGNADGSAGVIITAGTEPFIYEWSNGETEEMISDLEAGVYTLTVTDANECSTTSEIEVGQNDALLAEVETIDESSLMSEDGSATAIVSGGVEPYTYEWSNGEITANFDNAAAGEYCVTVTDEAGCTVEACGEVLAGDDPCIGFEVSISGTEASCFDGTDGSGTVSITGGTEPITWIWEHDLTIGNNVPTVDNLAPGTYTVVATDVNLCMQEATIEIGSPDEITLSIEGMDESILNAADGSATVTASGGTAPYSYEWSDANAGTTEMITGLIAGEYCVTIIDAANCTAETCVEILAGEDICADFSINTSSEISPCFGIDGGVAVVETTGGLEPFAYEWSNGETSQLISDLAIGNYTVTVTDANACVLTDEVEITTNDEIILQLEIENESSLMSADGTASAMASGGVAPFSYDWSTGDETEMITGLVAGEYCVTITDALGCIAESCGEVFAGDDLCADFSISIAAENAPCFGSDDGAALVETTGGTEPFSFEWSNGETEQLILGLAVGVYAVTVTDANDCVATAEVEITQSDEIILEVFTVDESSLMSSDGSATAMVSGGNEPYTYNWSNANNMAEITGLTPGEYCVTVTDNFGCTAEACGEVLAGDDPCVGFEVSLSGTDATCFDGNDGTASVTINGGTTPIGIVWEHDFTLTNITTINNLAPGTYTAIVTDGNLCTQTVSIDIGSPDQIIISLNGTDESTLNAADGSATATVTGGTAPYTYLWTNGDATAAINMLTAGEYCVLITDAQGCTSERCIDIAAGSDPCPDLTLSTTGMDVSCFGGDDGVGAVSISGGTAPYSIMWSDGQAMETASNLVAGTYTVSVTDVNGCGGTSTVEIMQASAITITNTGQSNESAVGAADGQISVSVSGGTMPYIFEWSTGASGNNIAGLSAGTYMVTVIDANDCMAEQSFTISTSGTSNGMATVQFIHAALDETISVESDQGMILPFFANTMTTPPMEIPAGQNMLLTLTPLNFWSNASPVTVGASFEEGKTYVAILYGTFDESDNNPVGIAIKEHNFGPFGETEVFFDFFNGAHDSPSFSLTNNADLEIEGTPYGEFASATDLASVNKPFRLDLFDADISGLTNSFWADFTWWKTRSAVLFTQGTLSERGSLELWVALADGGAYRLNGYFNVGGQIINPGSLISNDNRLSIAPNPAKETPNVKLELIEKTDVDMLIYHSSGKLVYRNSFKQLDAGVHDLSPLGLNLGTGNYFVELKTNSGKHMVPIIIVD